MNVATRNRNSTCGRRCLRRRPGGRDSKGAAAAIIGDRMPTMAFLSASERDVFDNGLRRLVVALAGCCLLAMGARAQPAGAAPPPVADDRVVVTTPATPTPEPAASGPTTADAAS